MDFFKTKYTSKISNKSLYAVITCMIIGSVIINSFQLPNLNLFYSLLTFIILNTLIFSVHHYKNILINITFLIVILILDACVYIFINNLIGFNQNEIIVDIKSIINALLEFVIYNILKFRT